MSEPIQALEAYFAGNATDEQMLAVEAWINADPANAKAFMEQLHFREVVGQHVREQADPSALVLTELAHLEEDEGVSGTFEDVTWTRNSASGAKQRNHYATALSYVLSHTFTPKRLTYAATAAALLLAVGLMVYVLIPSGSSTPPPTELADAPKPIVARIDSSIDAVWSERYLADGSKLRQSDTLMLASGFAEVTFERGATLVIQGPAVFETVGPNAVRLSSGQFTANVPEPAVGFVVQTPNARITDYGTEFGVVVEPGGMTHAQTYMGQIGLAYEDGTDEVALNANEAAVVDGSLKRVAFEDLALLRQDEYQERLSRPRLTGDLRFVETLPKSLVTGQLEDDQYLFVIPEQAGIDLGSIEGSPVFALTEPGHHHDFWINEPFYTAPGQQPLPHRVVDAYLVHYDRVGSQDVLSTSAGTLTFDRPIVGVITNGGPLKRLDELVGLDGVQYPPEAAHMRGLEGRPGTNFNDYVAISEDRKTLTVRFGTS
ncbi:MAG: hypothetical protein AAF085_15290, partial [Planctomycetota bacterium]